MWNYRVVKIREGEEEVWSIQEAFYGPDGLVNGLGDAAVQAESRDALYCVLADMRVAFREPVVQYDRETQQCSEPSSWLQHPWPRTGRVERCQSRGES
jgi:hypothetical protein